MRAALTRSISRKYDTWELVGKYILAASGKFGELYYDQVYAISTAMYISPSLPPSLLLSVCLSSSLPSSPPPLASS